MPTLSTMAAPAKAPSSIAKTERLRRAQRGWYHRKGRIRGDPGQGECQHRGGQLPRLHVFSNREFYGWSPKGPSTPASIRSDSNITKALSKLKTSAAASLPVYLATTGSAACCDAASR
jgi:hypothetical protein